jgi:hypothetical protein
VKKISLLILTLITFLFLTQQIGAAQDIRIIINGAELELDVPPRVIEGRTMVPLRAVFEALEAEVKWIADERKIIATRSNNIVELIVDQTVAKRNGQTVTLDVPAQIFEGRTLVPIRFVAESFGDEVIWDNLNRVVRITKGDLVPPWIGV